MNYDKVTRVQIITPEGTMFYAYFDEGVILDLQDEGRTLKIFTKKISSESEEEDREAYKRWLVAFEELQSPEAMEDYRRALREIMDEHK